MRLDQVLVEFFEIESRTKAQALIADGKIRIDGKIVDKASYKVTYDQHEKIEIVDQDVLRYVSRAGIKLEKAIARLGIDLRTKQVLDIGQSTGGFTDCALEHGARRVVGVDVGHGQLHKKLLNDPRCLWIENLHVKDLKASQAFLQLVPVEKFDYLIVDVSFISLKQVVPFLTEFLKPMGKYLALVKPQYEVENTGRALDDQFYSILEKSMRGLFEENFGQIDDYFQSELQGKDGTTEFFIYGKKTITIQR